MTFNMGFHVGNFLNAFKASSEDMSRSWKLDSIMTYGEYEGDFCANPEVAFNIKYSI